MKKERATWLTAQWLTKVSVWKTDQQKYWARKRFWVEFKKVEGEGYRYKLESIPEQFLEKQTA